MRNRREHEYEENMDSHCEKKMVQSPNPIGFNHRFAFFSLLVAQNHNTIENYRKFVVFSVLRAW